MGAVRAQKEEGPPAGRGRRGPPAGRGRRGRLAGRRGRQGVAAAVTVAYLAAAGLALLGRGRIAAGPWLALHLLLLGAVSNAIVSWSEQFAATLLHVRPLPPALGLARLLVLNAGIVAVLDGVAATRPRAVVAGAVLVGAAVVGHVAALAVMAGRSLAPRLRVVVWYYVAGGASLVVGVVLGALLGVGAIAGAARWDAVRLAHAHVNLLGWVGLAVLGTQVTLWPTMLRTRMVAGAVMAARRTLVLAVAGLALTVTGFLAGWRAAAGAGLACYLAGVAVAAGPFVRTLRQRRPREAAPWMLAAAMAWFAAAVAADTVVIALRPATAEAAEQRLAPAVVVGFAAQVLVGALTYLLPVVRGGGPQGGRRLARLLSAGWPVRVAAVNAGLLAVVTPGLPGWAGRLGWWLVGVSLGAFVVLAAGALVLPAARGDGGAKPAAPGRRPASRPAPPAGQRGGTARPRR